MEDKKGYKISSSKEYMAVASMNFQLVQMVSMCLPENGPTSSQERMEQELRGSPASTDELFPMNRFRKEGTIAFSCVLTGNPTRLQWIVLI